MRPAHIALFMVMALLAAGCQSAIRTHAIAADTLGQLVNEAGTVIQRERDSRQRAAVAAHQFEEDARAAVAAVRETFRPILEAHGEAVAAQLLYADAVTLAFAAGRDDAVAQQRWLGLAVSVLALIRRAVELAVGLGLQLPRVPGIAELLGNFATPSDTGSGGAG